MAYDVERAHKPFGELIVPTSFDFITKTDPRKAFDAALIELALEDPMVYGMTADLGTGIPVFAKQFPDRYIDFGIAEQNMIAAASGLSLCGIMPYVTTFACFLSMRGCEQIRTDLAYPQVKAVLVGFGAGVTCGTLGSTHHATEDMGIMRSMPGMTVLSPAGPLEVAKAVKAAKDVKGPVYIRIGRGLEPVVYESDPGFTIGKGIALCDGSDIAIIATGIMLAPAIKAAKLLSEKGIGARVLNIHTIKPIDCEMILAAADGVKCVITVEDHNIIGGLGSAVAEVLCERKPTRMVRMGIPDRFTIIADSADIYESLWLTWDGIAERAIKALNGK